MIRWSGRRRPTQGRTRKRDRRFLSAVLTVLTIGLAGLIAPATAAAADAPHETAPRNINRLEFDFDRHGLPDRMHGGNILHAWNMSFNYIRERLPEIAAAGFGVIQTSPIGESITRFPDDPTVPHWYDNGVRQSLARYPETWWMLYQPTSWNRIGNMLGTEDEFRAMASEAALHGIRIIVDAVPNHLTTWWYGIDEDLRHPWLTWGDGYGIPGSGHPVYDQNISNWNHRYYNTRQRLVGLVDVDTTNEHVQQLYMDFLARKIDAGATGFRYDAVAHIELPCPWDGPYMCSDFWPNILDFVEQRVYETHGIEAFQYGELLNAGLFSRYMDALPNMLVPAYQYARGRLWGGILNGNLSQWDANWANGIGNHEAHRLVPLVETHDTYGNQGPSRHITDDQIRVGWSIITARAETTPLFFVRPGEGFTNNGQMFAPNGDGSFRNVHGHQELYLDPTVTAVNWFANHFIGHAERTSTHGSVALIERGATPAHTYGVTIVNSGSATATVDFPVNMADGTYIDQVTGAEFVVAGGRITGPALAGRGVAVVHNFEQPAIRPGVDASPGTSTFDTDAGVTVTLSARNATDSSFTVVRNATEVVTPSTPFVDGEQIVIGADAEIGDVFTLTLTATDGEETATASFDFHRTDPLAAVRVEFTHPSWNQVHLHAWTDGGSNITGNWPGVAMTRETVDGQDLWAFTFAPGQVTGSINVIFNNAAGSQTDTFTISGSSRVTHTGEVSTIIPPLRPAAFATPGSGTFATADGIEVTLHALRTTAQTFTITSDYGVSTPVTTAATPFSNGQRITIGEGSFPGDVFTLTVTGTDGTYTDTRSFEFIRVDPTERIRVEFTHPTWSQARIWAWSTEGNHSGGDWNSAPLMQRETVDGVDVWVHYLPGNTPVPLNLIFHNGAGQQTPQATITRSSRITHTGAATPVFGAPLLYTSPGSGTFTGTEGVTVTLNAHHMRTANHAIQGTPFPAAFTHGDTITFGADRAVGQSIYIDLTGVALDGTLVNERFTFTRVADESELPDPGPGPAPLLPPLARHELTSRNSGSVAVSGWLSPGSETTLRGLAGNADVDVWFYVDGADPIRVQGTTNRQGHLTIAVPAEVTPGRFPLAVFDQAGGLLGWNEARVR